MKKITIEKYNKIMSKFMDEINKTDKPINDIFIEMLDEASKYTIKKTPKIKKKKRK